jgi:hypothetical protein
MSTTPLTYAALNEKNRLFWEREIELLNQRIQDPYIYQLATGDMTNEELRGVPLRNRKSMAQAFADADGMRAYVAEETRKGYRAEFARKGGRAAKSDRLQKVILSIVRRDPQVTAAELLPLVLDHHEFEREDDSIAFGKGNGAERLVPISGLKDRLHRAKKKLYSR